MVDREKYREKLREEYAHSDQLSSLPYEVGVYTQGKVGSKAVLAALEDAFGVYLSGGRNPRPPPRYAGCRPPAAPTPRPARSCCRATSTSCGPGRRR